MEGCKGQVIKKEVKRRGDVFNARILIHRFIETITFHVRLSISKPFEILLSNIIINLQRDKNIFRPRSY